MTEAELFKECREALGYSVRGMADEMLVGERSIFRWEADTLDVAGPAWVIILNMLKQQTYEDEEALIRLVQRTIGKIREENQAKRRERMANARARKTEQEVENSP